MAQLLKLIVRRPISFYNEEDGILLERVLHKSQSMLCKVEWITISCLAVYTICEIIPNPLNYFCVMTDFTLCDESYAIINDECFNITEMSLC